MTSPYLHLALEHWQLAEELTSPHLRDFHCYVYLALAAEGEDEVALWHDCWTNGWVCSVLPR